LGPAQATTKPTVTAVPFAVAAIAANAATPAATPAAATTLATAQVTHDQPRGPLSFNYAPYHLD
jgi:hypothetical protein